MKANRREHIKPLTGLRFFAALLVFIHHLPRVSDSVGDSFSLGAVGVAFFFVLSGFILTYVYHGKIDSWKSVKKFWFARWARIWPVHFVTLVACAVFILGWSKSFATTDDITKFILNLFLIQTWVPDLQWAMGYNHVSWSIATEFFFYAAFPFLILLPAKALGRCFLGLTVACVGAIAVASYSLHEIADPQVHAVWLARLQSMIHVNPVPRLCEFMLGMLIGHYYLSPAATKNEDRSFVMDSFSEVATVLVAGAAIYIWALIRDWIVAQPDLELWAVWVKVSSVAVASVPVIYVFATRRGLVSWLLSTRVSVYLGEISFAFYMVHQLVIRALRNQVNGFWSYDMAFCATITFVLSIAISAIVFEVVEMPLRNLLIRCYKKQWKAGASEVVSSLVTFLNSRVVVGASIAIVAAILLVNSESKIRSESIYAYKAILPVMTESIIEPGKVAFENDAVLCGATVESGPDQSILIHLVWEKRTSSDRNCFVHIVDENNQIVFNRSGYGGQKKFQEASLHRKFLQKIAVNKKQLAGGVKIGVGLYSKSAGVAKVSDPADCAYPLSMHSGRLDLVHFDLHPSGMVALRPTKANSATGKAGTIVR